MTTTYDPQDPAYLDQADVRNEMTRVFDVCQGCRACVDLCSAFPTLFAMLDRHVPPDAGRLTPADQDRVVDECHQCMLCALDCPYAPELDDSNVDVPRLMLRARAMRHAEGITAGRPRAARLLGRIDRLGKLATGSGPIADKIVGAPPGSVIRRAVRVLTGISAERALPPYARQRFSAWFARRPNVILNRSVGRVTVFPSCLVEYQAVDVGKDLVKVYERNGIECAVSTARCCGAPLLHAGDIEAFATVARANADVLAAEVRAGTDVVVPQPTCSLVLRQHYVAHMDTADRRADAELVAEHTHDAAEFLLAIHAGSTTSLDTDFGGDVPDTVAYHAPCHLRAQEIGLPSRDLIKLIGAEVTVVPQCSGLDGVWGLRAGNEEMSIPIAQRLGAAIAAVGAEEVAGDCHLSNTAIAEQTGISPRHPLQLIARAYGITEEI